MPEPAGAHDWKLKRDDPYAYDAEAYHKASLARVTMHMDKEKKDIKNRSGGKAPVHDPYAVPKKNYKSKADRRSKDMLAMDSKELLKYTQSRSAAASKVDDPYQYDAEAYDNFRKHNFNVAQQVKSDSRDSQAAGLKLKVGQVIMLQARFRSILTRMRYRKHLLQLQQDREVRELERKAQQHKLVMVKQREMVPYTQDWYRGFRTALIRVDPKCDKVVSDLKEAAREKVHLRGKRKDRILAAHPKVSDMEFGGDTVMDPVNTVQAGKYYEFKQPPPSVKLQEYPPSELETKKRPTLDSPILRNADGSKPSPSGPERLDVSREGSQSTEPKALTVQQVLDRGAELEAKLAGARKKVVAAEEEVNKPGWQDDKKAELEKRLGNAKLMVKTSERAVKNWQPHVDSANATLSDPTRSSQIEMK